MPALLVQSAVINGTLPVVESATVKADVAEDVDLELVERAREGDRIAFRKLVERYQKRAHAIALGMVGNFDDAEDIAQEAFLKAYRNLATFRGQSSFYTWLYRIIVNLSIDLSRKSYRRSEISMGEDNNMDAAAQSGDEDTSVYLSKTLTP